MRLSLRTLLVGLILLSFAMLPTDEAHARPTARQITITITEAQFNRYLASVRPRSIRKLEADIIDGGIIMKVTTSFRDLPEYHEHYGVLIRDNEVVTEAGVFSIPGYGGIGYADIKQLIPSLVPLLNQNARVINRFVQRQISAKARTCYKPESVTTGGDQVVIVVSK